MATYVVTDHFLSIGGTDLSDWLLNVTVDYEAEAVDETAMGETTRKMKGGLKNWTVNATFKQDFAASSVDVTVFSLVGTTSTIIVRPTSSAVGSTNPNYTGTGLITKYVPVGNGVGELAGATLEIVAAGTLSRATS